MKLNYKRTFLIGLAFLSISAFWQMYDNVIPLILKNTFGLGETVTGAIMAADNVLALFLLFMCILLQHLPFFHEYFLWNYWFCMGSNRCELSAYGSGNCSCR